MKEADKQLLAKALGNVFIDMFNSKTNTAQLTLNFDKFLAKFEIVLIDVIDKQTDKSEE